MLAISTASSWFFWYSKNSPSVLNSCKPSIFVFFVDGFEYQFISVEPYEDWAIEITVNVLLPKKGQSYVVEKFSYDIYNIH